MKDIRDDFVGSREAAAYDLENAGRNVESIYYLKADKKYQRYLSVDMDQQQYRVLSPPPDLTEKDQEDHEIQDDKDLSQTDKKSDHIIKMRRSVRKHPDRSMIHSKDGNVILQPNRQEISSDYDQIRKI